MTRQVQHASCWPIATAASGVQSTGAVPRCASISRVVACRSYEEERDWRSSTRPSHLRHVSLHSRPRTAAPAVRDPIDQLFGQPNDPRHAGTTWGCGTWRMYLCRPLHQWPRSRIARLIANYGSNLLQRYAAMHSSIFHSFSAAELVSYMPLCLEHSPNSTSPMEAPSLDLG